MFDKKTYYTELQDKIVQIPKKPEYHANKMTQGDYERLTSPGGETIRTTKYNLSMYTTTKEGSGHKSPLGMSIYHDPKNAYTYLKR